MLLNQIFIIIIQQKKIQMNYWTNWNFSNYMIQFDPNCSTQSNRPPSLNEHQQQYQIPIMIPFFPPICFPSISQNNQKIVYVRKQEAQSNQNFIIKPSKTKRRSSLESQESQKNLNKKKQEDLDYSIRSNIRTEKKIEQIPERNKISNVLRAFLKLILNKEYMKSQKNKISRIIKINKLNFSCDSFSQWLTQKLPYCSNYINKNQFKRLFYAEDQQAILFRILLKEFCRVQGLAYISTVSNRKKIFKKNKEIFIKGLRNVEEIYFGIEQLSYMEEVS